ncbi:MAG: PKD domain-containing protein [Flavobacteriales bacterium]|nr:PKD domain-containing protein [Flavobacteriales bacterium]
MKRTIYSSVLISLLACTTAQATHMSGGEIYWENLGGNQYRITLTIYRDCAGIQLDNDYDLDISSPCGQHTLNVSTPGGVELSQLCDLQLPNSTCNGGTLPGIQKYVYTGTITLAPCDSWTISWTEIYRNNAIVNLQAPGTLEMYIEGVLNNSAGPLNDSPQFTNTAIPYICLGYPISYSYGAFDPEGDSLSYQLIGARVGGANPIAYTPPYTGTSPITGLTLDPATGLVQFTLNLAGNWVVVVQVNEYDNAGNLIGTIMRDMQFVAYPCSNIPPDPTTGTVSGMTGGAVQTAPYAVQVCESGDFCFDMVITDPNANNVLEATTNIANNLPGATFSYTGTNPITCHVCWNAGAGTAGFYPFIVNVNDGACPVVAFQTYVYSITVIEGLFIDVTSTNESCAGMNDGTGTVNIVSGTGPYLYNWATSGATTASITAGAGTYPVQVTDGNGCVAAPENAVIATTQPPVSNAGPDQVACYGTWPISLNGSSTNAASVAWSGTTGTIAGSGASVSYWPSPAEIAAGGADLILTANANGTCPDDLDTLHVAISNEFVSAAITATNANCNGAADGTASFTPSASGITYAWSTVPVQTTSTATGLYAGNYSVTATDTLGCPATLSISLTEPSPILITGLQSTTESCAGSNNGTLTANVSGGTAPYHFSWNNGDTTATITVGAGSYSVSVTDANGCTPALASATVAAAAQPNSVQAGPDQTICMNDYPISLQGAVVNATGGIWSGGAGTYFGFGLNLDYTPNAAEIASGGVDMILTSTGNTGCPADQDTVHLTLSNSFLNAAISGTSALCAGGNTGTATFVPSLQSLTYLWTPSGQTSATATSLSAGIHSVSVTDALGCDTTMSVLITEPTALSVLNVQGVDPTCAGSTNGSVLINVTGGTPGYTYQWSANTGGQTTASATDLGTGTYVVTATDANGCSVQGSATITEPLPILLTAQVPDTVCVNAPVQLTAQASGGDGNLTINWAGIGTGNSITYSFPASQVVAVSVSDGAGCAGPTLAFPVTVLDLSTATLLTYGDTTVCTGGSAIVGAQMIGYPANVTFNWVELSNTNAGPHIVPVSNTQTLHVTATNGCGQSLSGTVELILEVPPQIALPAILGQGCAPLTVQFPDSLTTQNVTWLWDLGDGTTSNAPAPVNTYAAGTYTVSLSVTTPAGCSASASTTGTIIAYSQPSAAFSASTYSTDMAAPTVEFTNSSTGSINSYDWTFGDGGTSVTDNPSHSYDDIGTFDVVLTVTDLNGCTDQAVRTIEILPIYDITIPNAFTPNPNGGGGGGFDPTDLSNDVFYPFVRFVKEFNMRIWNRWGELVFESNDVSTGWDGYYRGQLSPQDVYVYHVDIRFVDDRTAERSGDLTLFR